MHRTKLEIVVTAAGCFLIMLAWRLLAPTLVRYLSPAAVQTVNILSIYSLALIPLGLLLKRKAPLCDYGITVLDLPKQVGVGILIGLGMASVLTLLPLALGLKQLVYTGSGFQSAAEALARLAYFILVIGLTEEFIFRGFLYTSLKELCLSDAMPILISSALFGLMHFSGLNFSQVITTGLIGAFFCICREKIPGCTLLSLVIAHGLHDWLIRLCATYF